MAARSRLVNRLGLSAWPAFILAIVAEFVFFTAFDPNDLHFFGAPLSLSRQAVYTIGFLGFWILGAAASGLALYLHCSVPAVDGCPLNGREPPPGCPKRDGGNSFH